MGDMAEMRNSLGLLLTLACTGENLAPDAVTIPWTPAPHAGTAWRWIDEHCVGTPVVPYHQVRWWVVEAPWWVRNQEIRRGEYRPPATILLSQDVLDSTVTTTTLRHEILHAQLGTIRHPPLFNSCHQDALQAGWTP